MTRAGTIPADLALGRVMMRVRSGIVRNQQYLRGDHGEREQQRGKTATSQSHWLPAPDPDIRHVTCNVVRRQPFASEPVIY